MDKPEVSLKSADKMESPSPGFRMIDVGEKSVTRRRAIASGAIVMSAETLKRIIAKTLPKGDVLALAEVAGIVAAKKTPELLPLCHSLNLDSVRVMLTPQRGSDTNPEARVVATAEVICHAKTGAEMEALVAVNAALLCIYDLTKAIDSGLRLEAIQLDYKEGGKSGVFDRKGIHRGELAAKMAVPVEASLRANLSGLRAAVLTTSDRCANGLAQDRTGPTIVSFLRERGAEVVDSKIVADEPQDIRKAVEYWARELGLDLIITTGGTGLSPRDQTPDALQILFEKRLTGFGESLRQRGAEKNGMSWLSRADAGQVGNAFVFMLPGSSGAVSDALEILDAGLPHLFHVRRGGKHG